jgi:hypothetical protein
MSAQITRLSPPGHDRTGAVAVNGEAAVPAAVQNNTDHPRVTLLFRLKLPPTSLSRVPRLRRLKFQPWRKANLRLHRQSAPPMTRRCVGYFRGEIRPAATVSEFDTVRRGETGTVVSNVVNGLQYGKPRWRRCFAVTADERNYRRR